MIGSHGNKSANDGQHGQLPNNNVAPGVMSVQEFLPAFLAAASALSNFVVPHGKVNQSNPATGTLANSDVNRANAETSKDDVSTRGSDFKPVTSTPTACNISVDSGFQDTSPIKKSMQGTGSWKNLSMGVQSDPTAGYEGSPGQTAVQNYMSFYDQGEKSEEPAKWHEPIGSPVAAESTGNDKYEQFNLSQDKDDVVKHNVE